MCAGRASRERRRRLAERKREETEREARRKGYTTHRTVPNTYTYQLLPQRARREIIDKGKARIRTYWYVHTYITHVQAKYLREKCVR